MSIHYAIATADIGPRTAAGLGTGMVQLHNEDGKAVGKPVIVRNFFERIIPAGARLSLHRGGKGYHVVTWDVPGPQTSPVASAVSGPILPTVAVVTTGTGTEATP